MATVADIVGRVRIRLQDRDSSSYAFATDVLEEFVDEGLLRLGPTVFFRAQTSVTPNGTTTEWDLTTTVGVNYRELEDVVASYDLPGWYVYGAFLIFEQAPAIDFTIRSVVDYNDVTDLPAAMVDMVVLYACHRALLWLLRRGGGGLRRYLTEQGDLEPSELERMAEGYRIDFYLMREDWGLSTYRRF